MITSARLLSLVLVLCVALPLGSSSVAFAETLSAAVPASAAKNPCDVDSNQPGCHKLFLSRLAARATWQTDSRAQVSYGIVAEGSGQQAVVEAMVRNDSTLNVPLAQFFGPSLTVVDGGNVVKFPKTPYACSMCLADLAPGEVAVVAIRKINELQLAKGQTYKLQYVFSRESRRSAMEVSQNAMRLSPVLQILP